MPIAVQLPGWHQGSAEGLASLLNAGMGVYGHIKQGQVSDEQKQALHLQNQQTDIANKSAQAQMQQLNDPNSPASKMTKAQGLMMLNGVINSGAANDPESKAQIGGLHDILTDPNTTGMQVNANFSKSPVFDFIKSQQEGQAKMLEAQAKAYEAGMPLPPKQGTKPGAASPQYNPPPKVQLKSLEDYNNAVSGSRQQPDAIQSLKDIQAGQKLSEIASQAPGGDLNKLNNQQMKLAMTEVVKMAGGSVPTEGELEQMTPDGMAQKYGGFLQKMTNKSQPANAGEFIKQAIDYGGGIQKLGAQKIYDRANELADRQRRYLGEQNYGLIKKQIGDEFKKNLPKTEAAAPGIGAVDPTKLSREEKIKHLNMLNSGTKAAGN